VLLRRDRPAGDATELMLAKVGRGPVDLRMVAGQAAMGPATIGVYLAGDANGDHRVTARDLALIRSLHGVHEGQSGDSLDADVNGDGVINARDWRLARLNLGVSTRVRPLAVTAAVSSASDPDGNGVVTSPTVLLAGRTAPGAIVRAAVTGSSVSTATAPATTA